MNTFLRSRSSWPAGLAAALLLLFAAAPARAEAPPSPKTVAVFAEGRSFTSFITNGSARDRVVQICVLCMLVALFIMLKKFAPEATGRRADDLPGRPTTEVSPERPSRKV